MIYKDQQYNLSNFPCEIDIKKYLSNSVLWIYPKTNVPPIKFWPLSERKQKVTPKLFVLVKDKTSGTFLKILKLALLL